MTGFSPLKFKMFGVLAGVMVAVFVAGFGSPTVALALEPPANAVGEFSFMPDEALTDEGVMTSESDQPLSLVASNSQVVELGGADRYETVAKEALYAYSKSDVVIVASGAGWADSIAAAGLAGAMDCPILLTAPAYIPDVTRNAIQSLRPSRIVLLGSEAVADANVYSELKRLAGSVERVSGPDRFATQMSIYQYGQQHGLWAGDTAVVVSATGYADALSVSPVSFKLKAPVFFCDWSGDLPTAQRSAIRSLAKKKYILTGSTAVTSSTVERWLSGFGSVRRLGGPDRYSTSFEIANYAVSQLGFVWDGLAFASGQGPYDSLGGGVVQGRSNSVLLLADSVGGSTTALSAAQNGAKGVSLVKFFGSPAVVPTNIRVEICRHLGVSAYANVRQTSYPISLDAMIRIQMKRGEQVSYDAFYAAMNPTNFSYGSSEFFQFALLNKGYSGLSASNLNQFVASNCSYAESSNGVKSTLRDLGDAFIEASRTYGVNEAYLLSHAIWESGWGCSSLARGWTPDVDGEVIVNGVRYPYYKGTTYYNFYGIGAVDSNALNGGRAMAVKEGWTSPRKAVLGAAKWISANYLNRPNYRQNTLYLMKFDVEGAVGTGSAWHEYCTGLNTWVLGISRLMSSAYGVAGYDPVTAPVTFDVPMYR